MDGHSLQGTDACVCDGRNSRQRVASPQTPRPLSDHFREKKNKKQIFNQFQPRTLSCVVPPVVTVSRQLRNCLLVTSVHGCLFRRDGPAMNWVLPGLRPQITGRDPSTPVARSALEARGGTWIDGYSINNNMFCFCFFLESNVNKAITKDSCWRKGIETCH